MFPDSTNIFKALLSHKDKLLEQILSLGAPVLIVNFNDLLISSTVIVQDILRVKNISSFLSSQIVDKKSCVTKENFSGNFLSWFADFRRRKKRKKI